MEFHSSERTAPMLIFAHRRGRRLAGVVCAALALLGAAGCHWQKTPTAYPVSGRVVLKGTGEAVPRLGGGYVSLESLTDPNNKPVGQIEDDGTFFLGTVVEGQNLGGVLPGEYRVRVVPPDDAAARR